ncbi:MAG: DnaB-like helicase C-terminal domain-containing protein, partial [Candidatus Omnitrophica bacterium]|nr:DnaB-like helicase C-terminal domain-containing protein [Candidatus Omnitrophota bacterium]
MRHYLTLPPEFTCAEQYARIDLMRSSKRSSPNFSDRVPPYSGELEMAIVGHILNYPHLIYETRLEPEMFYKTCNSLIFKAFCNMREQGKNIDLMTVAEELKGMRVLDDIGGFYYLTTCSENVFSSASFQSHEEIIINKYLRRKVIMRSQEFMTRSYQDDEKIEEIIFDMAHANVEIEGRKDDTIKTALLEAVEFVDLASSKEFTGLPTGIPKIDEMTSGFQDSELVIIGGRPSTGKTSLAGQIMINVGINHKVPVGLISIEMPKKDIAMRMASQISGLDFFKIRTGRMTSHEREKFGAACEKMA